MKLGLVTQLRNEIDIVEAFIRHVDALFDRVYFIDHQSMDGTGEVLKQAVTQRASWSYYFLESKTKLHAEASNFVMHEAFRRDTDFLFFLDTDEFIQVDSRQRLEDRLMAWTDLSTLCALKWKNCICQAFSNLDFSFQTPLWIPPAESIFEKVIVPRELYLAMGKNMTITAGSHAAHSSYDEHIAVTTIGTLFHVPIRSLEQALKKAILTVIAHRGYKERIPGNGFQFYEMLETIARGGDRRRFEGIYNWIRKTQHREPCGQ